MRTSLMHENDYLCMDISGRTPVPNQDLIAYPCQGGWNQYFRFSHQKNFQSGNGAIVTSISATIPAVVSEVMGMSMYPSTLCIEGRNFIDITEEDDNFESNTDIVLKSNICQEQMQSISTLDTNTSDSESTISIIDNALQQFLILHELTENLHI